MAPTHPSHESSLILSILCLGSLVIITLLFELFPKVIVLLVQPLTSRLASIGTRRLFGLSQLSLLLYFHLIAAELKNDLRALLRENESTAELAALVIVIKDFPDLEDALN